MQKNTEDRFVTLWEGVALARAAVRAAVLAREPNAPMGPVEAVACHLIDEANASAVLHAYNMALYVRASNMAHHGSEDRGA